MKQRSTELALHQAQRSTTLAWCWRFERRDGQVFCFTSCDNKLRIDGEVYGSVSGLTPSALAQSAGLAVDNTEVNGALIPGSITEEDLVAGRWDGAFMTMFEVNYRDLSMGRMVLRTGYVGNVQAGRVAFQAEMRGLAQLLQQTVGALYTKNCRHTLGDAKCGVNTAAITATGAFTAVTSRRVVADSGRGEATDRFTAGLLRVTSGLNAGVAMEIAAFDGGEFALVLPLPFNPAVGDTYEAVPGCRKRHERSLLNPGGVSDCIDGFNNILNFGGFPFVPGGDKVLGLGGTEGTNL